MDARIQIILRILEEQKGYGHLASGEACKLLGLSEAYFLRLFHREVRTPFRRYLRKATMIRAAELLKDPTVSIKKISFDSGYNDVSNFYRDFKQVLGINPGQVRTRHVVIHSQEDWIGTHSPATP